MRQMLMLFPGGRDRALTLSYDDGVRSDLRLIELIKKYGVKGTFNINSGCFAAERSEERTGRMTREECLKAYDPEICEVALHTVHHTQLNALPAGPAAWEVLEDRRRLEEMFDRPIRGLAYPFSRFSDEEVNLLRALGVCYARGGGYAGDYALPKDYLRWMPTCRHRDADLMDKAEEFLNKRTTYDGPFLFMLMGHTYEFEREGNWPVMERFLQKMGGREDVWYATCQEIFDAHQNFRRLICSADGRLIHNPSYEAVWVRVDGQTVKIAGGQTARVEA